METGNRQMDYETLMAKMQYGRELRSQLIAETIIHVYKKLQGLFNRWRIGIETRDEEGVRYGR